MKNLVGIIGGGVVGSAVKNFFDASLAADGSSRRAKVYDKYKNFDSIEDVAQAKFIFICVPTPYTSPPYQGGENKGGGFDLSALDDAIANTITHLIDPDNQLIVIKSTAWPGTTQKYQDKYPQVNFAFNPEFLRDKTANEDFMKNDRQIVGYTTKTKGSNLINELMDAMPRAPFEKIVPSEVAEMIKYATNTFLALRVIFANQIYDICQTLDIDYELVKDAVISDKRIGKSHWDIWHTESSLCHNVDEEYRGYGGKCFPKDINILIVEGQKLGIDVSLFEAGKRINLKLNGGKYDQ